MNLVKLFQNLRDGNEAVYYKSISSLFVPLLEYKNTYCPREAPL